MPASVPKNVKIHENVNNSNKKPNYIKGKSRKQRLDDKQSKIGFMNIFGSIIGILGLLFMTFYILPGFFHSWNLKQRLYGRTYQKYNNIGELEYEIEFGFAESIHDKSENGVAILKPTQTNLRVLHFRGIYEYDKKTKKGKLTPVQIQDWDFRQPLDFTISGNTLVLLPIGEESELGGMHYEK